MSATKKFCLAEILQKRNLGILDAKKGPEAKGQGQKQ
jgi:hypothetical protein